MNTGAKVGIALGALTVVGLGIFLLTRKNKSIQEVSVSESDINSDSSSTSVCPDGFTKYGDGSACVSSKNPSYKCSLWGNAGMGSCYCPSGMTAYGDGSACKNSEGTKKCAKYGNRSLVRC